MKNEKQRISDLDAQKCAIISTRANDLQQVKTKKMIEMQLKFVVKSLAI